MTGIRDRLLHRIGVPTEPKHVERASRRERWKRDAWMVGSLVLSGAIVIGLVYALEAAEAPTGALLAVLLVLALDMFIVFPWGVERFDLVAPWQFRDAEVDENE